jgi:O-antigen/teichoic acid export membrane protein
MNRSLRALLSLSWQSLAYGIGVLGSQLIIYLMLPFLTRYMPQEEYGVISVIISLYAFLNMLTNAGLPPATFRFYNDTTDEQDRRFTLGSSQFLFFLFAIIPATVVLLYSKPISTLLLGADRYALALQLAACFLIVDTLNIFGGVILRIQVRPLLSSIHSIITIGCEMGMAILFVTVYNMGVVGYWLGYLIGGSIGLAFMLWFVRKAIVFDTSWKKIVELMKFGVPLIPAAVSMTVLRVADRYIIGSLAGLPQVAVYDVGYKAGSIIVLLIAPFRAAWAPFAFSISQKPEAPRVYRDVLTYLSAGCSFLILGVIAFRFELIHIMAPASYDNAVAVVSWVAASQLFLAIYLVLSIGLMINKKTYHLAWIAVFAGGLNLLLNFALIPFIGILGAAISTFVSYAALAISAYFVGKSSFDIQVDWRRLGKLSLVIGLVALVILAAEHSTASGWTEIVIKVAGLLSFPILLFLIRFVNLEWKDLLDAGKKWLAKKSAANDKGEEPR